MVMAEREGQPCSAAQDEETEVPFSPSPPPFPRVHSAPWISHIFPRRLRNVIEKNKCFTLPIFRPLSC